MLFSFRWRRVAGSILAHSEQLRDADDAAFAKKVSEFQWKLLARQRVRRVQREIYAVAVEAIRRETGMLLRPTQIGAAIGLTRRCVIELQTGEGKTLAAVPAACYYAMMGQGCHVVTSNPYLAERDANSLRPIYQRLGLTVGCVLPSHDQEQRRAAYECDIVYGTASEFGFDFLRDRLLLGAGTPLSPTVDRSNSAVVHRGFFAAIIDEADSVLIDEASTPLIIGTEVEASEAVQALYHWANHAVQDLASGQDFTLTPSRLIAHLTEQGARRVILRRKPTSMDALSTEEIFEQTERALVANHLLVRDRDYVVKDDELTLVSGSTGRRLIGRKWQKGLHQAVEAKEGLDVSSETATSSRITIQEFFGLYNHLAGMTGTARTVSGEFKRFYRLKVQALPTHNRCIRRRYRTGVFVHQADKFAAIIDAVSKELAKGRTVLVGTPSVEASEKLAKAFTTTGLTYRLLNANQDAEEAEVVARAGEPSIVTIATNMAGRGTDIILSDQVREAGGLHVIVTEVHASRRIDRQLVGRAARQGEPGSFQFLISRDDEIWAQLPHLRPGAWGIRVAGIHPFRVAQKQLERRAEKQRIKMFKASRSYRQNLRDAGFDLYLETSD